MPSSLCITAADNGAPAHPTRATVASLHFDPDEKLEACILTDLTSSERPDRARSPTHPP